MIRQNVARWFVGDKPEDSSVVLFCFPHAGGGAYSYRMWYSQGDPRLTVVVIGAGGPFAFTMADTTLNTVTVSSTSAATIIQSSVSTPHFTSSVSRLRWAKAGRPPLPALPHRRVSLQPPGVFNFLPLGRGLTFSGVQSLGTSSQDDITTIADNLGTSTRSYVARGRLLEELGFLLATGPLTEGQRVALFRALDLIPGISLCSIHHDLIGRPSVCIQASNSSREIQILFSRRTGSLLAVEVRLRYSSILYPAVEVGSLLESYTFAANVRGMSCGISC